ncbi:hypothetical protein K492DRAFT_207137 [Lichtheimia hyalospora FSU 10163]|nr:hypothetical protein K492DRAFT_207137 [Lichtheimia hyalospora FSU 10163]
MNEYATSNGVGHSTTLFESDGDIDLRIMQLHKAIREQHILLEALDDDGQLHHHDVSDLKSRISSLSEQLNGSTTGTASSLITRYELNKKRLEDLQSEGYALEKELEYLMNTGIQSTLDALTRENNRLHELTQVDNHDCRIMDDINSLRQDAHYIIRHELSNLSLSSSSSNQDRQKQQERQMFEKGLFVSAPLARFIESLHKPASSSPSPSPAHQYGHHSNTVYRQQSLPPSPPVSNPSNTLNSQRSTVDVKAEAQRRIEQRRLLFASKNSKSTSNLRARREHVTCAPEQTISEDEKAAQQRLRKAEADARERLQTMRERRNKARLESREKQKPSDTAVPEVVKHEESKMEQETLRQQQHEQEKRMAEEQRQREIEEQEKRMAEEQRQQREIEEQEKRDAMERQQREIEEQEKRLAEEQRQREIEEQEKRIAEEQRQQREIEEKAAEEQRQRRARFAAEQAAKEKRLRQEEFERKAREIEAAQIEAEQRQQQWLAEQHKHEQTPLEDPQEHSSTSHEQQDDTITSTIQNVDLSDEVDFNTIYRVKTLYEYRGTREDDLCFKEDEVIKAYPHKDSYSDWWYGTSLSTNQAGFFPRTYVEVVDQAFRVRTLYAFQKTREDDLGFTENEIIVVQPFQDEDSEWWYGTNEETHQSGYFPKTYVEVIPLGSSTDTPEIHSNNASDPAIMLQAPPEDDSSRNMSAPNTPVMKKETLSANRSETARRRRAASNVGLSGSTSAPIDRRQTSSPISSMPMNPGLVTWASTMDPSELAVISSEERKRQEAIFELITTEKSYLRDLQLIINVYYTESMKYLARDEQDVVFSNIDDLLLTNTALLSDMEARQNEEANVVSKIGDIFLKHADNLKCYSTYCRNQSFASRLLQDKRKQDQWFNVFLKTAQSRPECRGLDLSHFLLEPMQRITRYPLLLQNILNATPRRHTDYGLLRSALIKTEAILQHVNEETRRYENIQKMDELSRILDMGGHANLKVHGREFVMEGVLYKAKSGRKLHGYLFNDALVLTEPLRELSPEGYLHRLYKEPLTLDRINIRQLPQQMSIKAPFSGGTTASSDDTGFQLVYGNQVISVKAASISQKRQWISQIQHSSALCSTIQRQSWYHS